MALVRRALSPHTNSKDLTPFLAAGKRREDIQGDRMLLLSLVKSIES